MQELTTAFEILNQPYKLTQEQINFYRENKYVKLKNVLNAETIAHFSKVIKNKVQELSTQDVPLEERDTYSKAFLQIMNIWTHDDEVKRFVFNRRVAQVATELMGVDGVRVYHDQALFKEPGGGFTPWHADQYYWPLSNDNTVTAWIPLQETPLEMGPLEFSAKSHLLQEGRQLKISDDSEQVISQKLRLGDFKTVIEPFELGEVSFHSGWVFHRAGANTTDEMRQVMTMIYMDKDMRLIQPQNDNQQADWDTWCPGAKVGEVINSPINPVIYEK
jgi:ectoine hydroxylase-related dioxygenase (phytanoyl-CoA dioxygenase family)